MLLTPVNPSISLAFNVTYLLALFGTTRTFPVNGTFTPPQRELYVALLATQKALVNEYTFARGHSLESFHCLSVGLLRAELGKSACRASGPF